MRRRLALLAVFCLMGGALIVSVVPTSHGSTPASGTVSEAGPKVTWSGPVKAPTGSADCTTANNAACDNYRLTIQPPSAAYGPYLVEIKLQPELAGDWDMQVYGPTGKLVDGSGNSPGQTELVVLINPPAGTYTVAAAPFAPVANTNGNSYTATAEIKKHTQNPAAPGADNNISYHNFVAPGSLGNSAGEPTIGVNWKTGKVMYIAGLQTLRVTFDDSAIPAKATWENKSAIFTGVITMDPILFTNPHTGRTIVSQLVTPAAANGLAVLTDGCSISGYTDDDGETWIIDQGCGLPSGADHQSVGGGPFAAPLPSKLPLPDQASGYSQATYYCAQSGVTAYCSRSDDGGVTYGPGVPVYTTECGGLHGHPMVAPDGTVYLPNKACGGKQGVTISEDNGLTWTVRTVPDSLPAANDPGVGVGANGTVYFGYQNGDGTPRVAVSRDKGRTWTPGVDVGTAYGIKNTVFPRVVAGDDDRAAFSFLGTPTAGPFQDAGFTGEWHLYISHTFDGGKTWSTVDATPTDPVQRGCIWMQGGSNPCRNLLDFMGSAVDKEGRVLVSYADGCINCTDPSTSRSKKATIARQVNGRRLFAAHDPSTEPTPTPTPTGTPTPTPTPEPNSACSPPGVTVVTDAAGDQTAGVTGATTAHDIRSVSIAEQYAGGVPRLVMTMKVANLPSTLPPNTNWRTFFTGTHADGTSTRYFVTATTANPPNLTFKYGFVDTTATGTSNLTVGDADGGSVSASDGTLSVVLAMNKLKKPVAGTPNSTLTGPQLDLSAGKLLTSVNGVVTLLAGTGATGGSNVTMDTTDAGTYTMAGQAFCQAQPTPTPTPESKCALPGVTVQSDASGDQLGAPAANGQLDIQSVKVAEPFTTAADSSISFTMKVGNLSGTLQPNSIWTTYFNAPDTSGTSRQLFVQMSTSDTPVTVSFTYGYHDEGQNFDVGQCFLNSCPQVTGSFSADGTITVKLSTGAPLAFSDINGNPVFNVDLRQPGRALSAIKGTTTLLIGAAGSGGLQGVDSTAGDGSYVTVGNAACQGGGTPTPTPTATVTPTPTPTATVTPTATPTPISGVPRYANYVPPTGIADDWGEPSVGANWQTGKVLSYGGFGTYMLRMSFDDATSPARVTWERMPLLLAGTPRAFGDPILFTDRVTGRTFVSQLVGLTPFNGMDFTDDDGQFFQPSQGSGIASGIDHQTVGGGPFHEPMPTGATYPHAVYYCAQEGLNFSGNGIANCALSVDGGRTFGPAVPVYASNLVNSCSPLHGHLKVAPDGTAYLPNKKCGDGAGMTYTEDNGVTWKAATVPNSTVGDSDASVGIATDGTVYIGYEGADGHAYAAVFNPQTKTFGQPKDVGAQAGIQNAIFPAVVAGDPGRAAFAFYGSSSPGDQDSPDYRGVWYLYVASTFDGGQTWTTVNATPGDPIQRDGICTRGFQGCAVPRNLLDFFDATVDKEGRVIVGYNDGCMGPCVQAGPNSNTSKGVIARQSGGKRLFAQYDPPEPTVPAAPLASATQDSGGVVHLSWPAPDNGGSAITSYKVYRRTDATSFALLATVPETGFDDRTAAANTSYTYRVSAVNAQGEGPASPDVKPAAGPTESPCEEPGITVANDTLDDGSDADAPQQVPPDARVNIRRLSVAEPYFEDGSSRLVFTLRMAPSTFASAPPLSQWYVIWSRRAVALDGSDRMYVAMKSDSEGKVSFEYGNFGPALPLDGTVPPPNANVPTRLGDADSASYDPQTGVLRITLSTSKAEGVAAGQSLLDLNARTFFARPEVGPRSQNISSDITGNGTYTLVGNASCKVNGAPTAVLSASPQAGFAPLAVSFDASGSFDRDSGDRVVSYTFDFGDGSPELTQDTPTVSHTYAAAGNFFARLTVTDSQGERSNNIATAAVEVRELPPPVVETIEDDDRRVAYSDAWHRVSDANASAGHFRYHTGKSPSHSAALSFDVPQGKTGAVTYHFARSPKGGTADIYLDGAFQRTINYAGSAGSTQKPEFAAGYKETFAGLAAGAHRLEIRNLSGVVYLDRFVLVSSTSTAQPAAGPGATTNQQGSVGAGSTSSSNYTMQPGAQGVSVVAESSLNLPFQLVLVDPSGLALETADASNGIATISRPVTQGGVYVIKVVNLSVGSLQITTTTTPLVKR